MKNNVDTEGANMACIDVERLRSSIITYRLQLRMPLLWIEILKRTLTSLKSFNQKCMAGYGFSQ